MPNTIEHGSYNTLHEIRFINSLGTNKKEGLSKHPQFLLEQYIKSCRFRYNWENIDRKKVIKTAQARLHLVSQGIHL